MQTPGTELTGASQNRAFSFSSDSNTNDVAVPRADKMRRKLDLHVGLNLLKKSALAIQGEGEGRARIQP
jgi:hypothetical protein